MTLSILQILLSNRNNTFMSLFPSQGKALQLRMPSCKIQKIPLTAKLDSAYDLVQFWLSSEFFSSNYFQIGQHVVLLHLLIIIITIIIIIIIIIVIFKNNIFLFFFNNKKSLFNSHKKDLCTVTHLKRIKTKFVLIIIICTNNNILKKILSI